MRTLTTLRHQVKNRMKRVEDEKTLEVLNQMLSLLPQAKRGRKPHKKYSSQHNTIRARSVLQYNLDGVFIREWKKGVPHICKELNLKNTNVYAVLNGKVSSSGGYRWRYKKETTPGVN